MSGKDYSFEAFNRFWDHVVEKGIMKGETAKGRKIAANKVLEGIDEAHRQDLRLVDVDVEAERFENLQGTGYLPASLQIYKSRTKSALADFLKYVESPSSFRPSVTSRAMSKGVNLSKRKESEKNNGESKVESANFQGPNIGHNHPVNVDHMVFPIPIRPGVMVRISNLPVDLTSAEAEKIASVVKALAMSQ